MFYSEIIPVFPYLALIIKEAKSNVSFPRNPKNPKNLPHPSTLDIPSNNANNDIKLQNLKDIATKLYNLYTTRKKQMSENMMLSLTKEERYRILGIKSDIVHSIDELLYISRWLSSEKVTKLELLFKGPFFNYDAIQFHSRYDNIVPCLILIETVEGARFGGFTNQTWKGENEYKCDNTAFLFSLDFLEKYPIDPNCVRQAILCKTQYFFAFGKGDLTIYDHCNKYICKSEFPVSYKCLNNNVNPKFRLTRYKDQFIVRDFEVFLVSFHLKNYLLSNSDNYLFI